MAKLQDCQFIEIKIDGKTVAGACEESTYKGWMEGFVPAGLTTYAGPDTTYFDSISGSFLATKESSELFEKYLNRGYNNIIVTIVHRGSDKLKGNYEIQRTVYEDCEFHNLAYEMRDQLFINFMFIFKKSVEVTFNVPNTNDNALEKIGPTKYLIPEKKLA